MLLGVTVTWMLSVLVMVTVAVPDIPGLKMDCALTITVGGEGCVAGAVYKPADVIEPQEMPEQPIPVTFQTTIPEPGPLAENWILAFGLSCAVPGETTSPEELVTIVAVALEETPGAATDVAEIVTCGGVGTADGAV
jgi:hypothetical protein